MLVPDYVYIGIFAGVGVAFVLVSFILAWVIQPHAPNPTKLSTYECGEETIGPAWVQYNVRYYIFALLFLIFDVEVIFLIPWAVVFKSLGVLALAEGAVFVGILLFGLAYVWKKGLLRWS